MNAVIYARYSSDSQWDESIEGQLRECTDYAERNGMTIVEDFNLRGLTTKRGKPFNMNSFNAVLKNRKYTGEYSYQDVVIPGGVPAIVPEDFALSCSAAHGEKQTSPRDGEST